MTQTETPLPVDMTNRSGVITGAGSGIGRALAEQFGRRGARLLLVGRREQALRETASAVVRAGGAAEVLAADITAEGAEEKVADTARTLLGRVDLLINNSGNVRAGRLEDCDVADVRAMVGLNLTAPILLTRALVPDLRAAAQSERSADLGGLGRRRDSIVLGIASGMACGPGRVWPRAAPGASRHRRSRRHLVSRGHGHGDDGQLDRGGGPGFRPPPGRRGGDRPARRARPRRARDQHQPVHPASHAAAARQ
ncbi:SDR family NAD(P)-dependent oxidoreductase [Microbispora catharanthi]|uniref:SDR family NAD(P)-dependent oxidoreductase n=1 Tax=Microbispora catharanthi TaxID=1712871 RepID=A0A5N6C5H3_9ACTN|nr:SDR family NAD(P)-dependent oxidoreductase [Microbispora catharanthi]